MHASLTRFVLQMYLPISNALSMDIKDIERAVQGRVRLSPLKSPRQRVDRVRRLLFGDGRIMTPAPYLVAVEDGRLFKLLRAHSVNRYRIDEFMHVYEAASQLDFVPKVLRHDTHSILLEFVVGDTPGASDSAFVTAFGRTMAQVHAVDVGTVTRGSLGKDLEADLAMLTAAGILDRSETSSVLTRLTQSLPETLSTSLLYGDLKETNLCLTAAGHFESDHHSGPFSTAA